METIRRPDACVEGRKPIPLVFFFFSQILSHCDSKGENYLKTGGYKSTRKKKQTNKQY